MSFRLLTTVFSLIGVLGHVQSRKLENEEDKHTQVPRVAESPELLAIFQGPPSDMNKDFSELCSQNDYQFETYQITTEDDYVLTMFRIPGKVGEPLPDYPKPPVLFQHGLLDSADCWIMNIAEKAPPFIAVDAGYDVWLSNLRGNKYSRQHVLLDPDNDKEFWDFSYPEHAKYDLPAMVKKIQQKSQDQKIAYLGHSMGTTMMFYQLINDYEFVKESFTVFIALAPVTKIPHHSSSLVTLMKKGLIKWEQIFSWFGIYEVFEPSWVQDKTMMLACGFIPEICKLTAGILATKDIEQDDEDRFQVYMGHYPSGTSAKSMFHIVQNLRDDEFQEFDYCNDKKNEQRYGVSEPPELDLTTIQEFPIAIFVGQDDELATVEDSKWIRDQITTNGNHESIILFEEKPGGHLSFHVGTDMSYFSVQCMNILKQYQPLDESNLESQ